MWLYYSLFFALWTSIYMVIAKKILKTMSPQLMSLMGILSLPFVLIILFLTTGISNVDHFFWIGVLGSSLLNVGATLSSFIAIKHAPISLIAPMSSFNPVFTTIFAFFALSEIPTFTKLLGIFIVVLGAYLLNVSDIKRSIFKPFISLFGNKFILLFLLANIIWAITPIFEKIAIKHTFPESPILVAGTASIFLSIFMLPIVVKTVKNPISQIKSTIGWFFILAPLLALAMWAGFTAYSLANLGYVTSIFKLSVIFTVILGALFFKEKRIKERLLGASVMIIGTILLVI